MPESNNKPSRLIATDRLVQVVRAQKARGIPAYRLALLAGYSSPGALSQVLIRAVRIRPDDARAQRLCSLIGLSFDQAFEPSQPTTDGLEGAA